MGKEAVQAKLKKVVIVHDPETAPASNYANKLVFEEGILTINWMPYSNTNENSIAERVDELKILIESKLYKKRSSKFELLFLYCNNFTTADLPLQDSFLHHYLYTAQSF